MGAGAESRGILAGGDYRMDRPEGAKAMKPTDREGTRKQIKADKGAGIVMQISIGSRYMLQ